MKLVARFAAVFFAVTCVWLALMGWFAAKREAQHAAERIRADVQSLADALEAGIAVAHATGGPKAVDQVVTAMGERRANVAVRLLPEKDAPPPGVVVREGGDSRSLAFTKRIVVGTAEIGTLEIVHPLPSESSLVRAALLEELAFALALGLVTGGLALGLGNVLIGQPLERVVAQARRIAAGDLSGRLAEDRTDEIGHLKRELNVMCDKLAKAKTDLEDEATAHVETLEQLRHLDRLRTVATLSSAVAHELGTPFNVVLLRAQSLVDEGVSDEDRRDAARVIVAQVDRMSRIVRQLLDFSRSGGPSKGPLSLGSVLSDVRRLLGPLAKKHGVSLEARQDADVTVDADPLRLEQVVTNLVMNAIAAMPEGGTVELRLTTDDVPRPGQDLHLRAARIDVIDQGTGISKEGLSRIFEPFYTTKSEGRGTGLGLSVVTGILEEHGGWLAAKSEEGHGSTFSVYLPLAT